MAKEVRYKLALDSGEFSKGLKEATSAFGDFGKSIAQGLGIGAGIKIGEEIGSAIKAAIAAIPAAVGKLAEFGDGLVALQARTGVGVEALQKFAFAGKLANVELGTITSSFGKFQNAMVSGNDKAAAGLSRIGLSFAELRNLSPEDQLSAIAAGFDKITNPALRTKTAIDIFGKSGAEMLQLFDGNMRQSMETAEALGLVMSKNVIGSAADLQDGLDTAGAAFEGLKNNLISVIVESEPLHVFLEEISKLLGEASVWVKKNQDSLRTWVDQGIAIAASSLSSFIEVAQLGMAVLKALADVWAVGVFAIKSHVAATQLAANAIAVGPTKAWAEFKNVMAANTNELNASLKSNQDTLDGVIGVSERMKEKTDAIGRAVIDASGKTHRAAEANRTLGAAYEETGGKAKTMAERVRDATQIVLSAGIGPGGLQAGTMSLMGGGLAPTLKTEESPMDKARRILTSAGIGVGGLEAGTMSFMDPGLLRHGEASSGLSAEKLGKAKEAAFDFAGALRIANDTMGALGISSDSFFGKFVGGALSAGAAMQNALKNIPRNAQGGLNLGGMSLGQGAQLAGGLVQTGAGIFAGASSNTGAAALQGAASGAMAGASFGPIGAGVGALVGGAIGIFGSGAKKKKELEDMRKALVDEFGGSLDAVKKKANELGVDIERAFSTKSPKEAKAAIEELHGAMSRQKEIIAGASEAMEAQNARAEALHEAVKAGAMSADDAGAAFDRLGIRMTASFGAMVKETGDVVGAIQQIGPGLEAMILSHEQMGTTASATSQFLIGMYTAVRDSGMGPALQAINAEMQGLAQAGMHSQAIFSSFGTDLAGMFGELTAKTGDQNMALVLMQPSLQRLWEMQRDFGYATDESTAALLRQAEEQGLVGDEMRSVQDKILQVLIAIADAAGAQIPEAFRRAKDAAQDYADTASGIPNPPVPGGGSDPYGGGGDFVAPAPDHGFLGFVPPTSGGSLFNVGERGRGEWIVPEGMESAFAAGYGGRGGGADLESFAMRIEQALEGLPRALRDDRLTQGA